MFLKKVALTVESNFKKTNKKTKTIHSFKLHSFFSHGMRGVGEYFGMAYYINPN